MENAQKNRVLEILDYWKTVEFLGVRHLSSPSE